MIKTTKNPTFFVDIDGTLVKYRKFAELENSVLEPIQDVIDTINNYYEQDAHIVITSARPDSYELFTKQELETIGVKYHQLILGLGRGTRVVINDNDPQNPEISRSLGVNLNRDMGWEELDITQVVSPYEV
jgi:hydroxymethylpyrimidine pyrophosphatase-like HAD family hydrolase